MVSPSTIRNETGGKRVCGGLRSKHAYGQQERHLLCRLGFRKVSKSPTTVVTANGEVLTQEEPTVWVKNFGFIRDGTAS